NRAGLIDAIIPLEGQLEVLRGRAVIHGWPMTRRRVSVGRTWGITGVVMAYAARSSLRRPSEKVV
ncbi:MAG: hypothetical protein ACE5JL_18680, partial [Dehalococcoidia bacterium]